MNVLAEKRDTQKWDDSAKNFTDGATSAKVALTLTDKVGASDAIGSVLTKETDTALIANDLTYYYMEGTGKDSKVSLKELRQDTYLNPNSPITTVASPEGYSDVMAVQAGGELVYTSTSSETFEFTFTPNQTQTITSAGYGSGASAVGGTTYDINGGTTYTVKVKTAPASGDDIEVDNTASAETINVKDLDTFYKYINDNIDTNSFKPKTTGLYIFKRNTNSTADAYPDYEFSGYYYVAKDTSDSGAQGKFFALQYENDGTGRSDYVLDKDTYTVTRDDTGKVAFYPYKNPGTYSTTKKASQVNTKWYDDTTGLEVDTSTTPVTAVIANNKSVTLFTAQKQVVENSALTWTYAEDATALVNNTEVENNGVVYTYKVDTDPTKTGWYNGSSQLNATTDATLIARLTEAASKHATLTASWVGVDGDASTTADNISVTVNLTNIGTAAEKWTSVEKSRTADDTWGAAASTQRTFYYNNDVEEGATTAKLVDSVELSKDTTKNAYIAFDFDLNVFMDSMQVTINDNGVESNESISPKWTSTGNAVEATSTIANTNTEITGITWDYATP